MNARVLWLGLVLLACGPRDIEVVELPGSEDGGKPMHGEACSSDSNCPPMDFCEKATCEAAVGECRRRPPACPSSFDPVCGCNNVNYWNDCYRQARGVRSRVAGQCGAPVTCGAGAPCADSQASCALLLPSEASCATVPSGVCWVTPSQCPASDSSWESCAGASICGGLCAAIRSGQIRREVNQCL